MLIGDSTMKILLALMGVGQLNFVSCFEIGPSQYACIDSHSEFFHRLLHNFIAYTYCQGKDRWQNNCLLFDLCNTVDPCTQMF